MTIRGPRRDDGRGRMQLGVGWTRAYDLRRKCPHRHHPRHSGHRSAPALRRRLLLSAHVAPGALCASVRGARGGRGSCHVLGQGQHGRRRCRVPTSCRAQRRDPNWHRRFLAELVLASASPVGFRRRLCSTACGGAFPHTHLRSQHTSCVTLTVDFIRQQSGCRPGAWR